MLSAMLAGALASHGQYSEDFDSFNYGDYIGVVSPLWTTWSGAVGGAEDAKVDTVEANSGSNSLAFESTSTSGGPQDVVLPFGGQFNTGQFTYSHSMFVESGTGAYFNFQADSTIGVTWALDFHFVQDGNYYLADANGNVKLTGTYPTNQWVDITVDIDLNTNLWELKIDGVSQGTFSNMTNQVASIDLFPSNSANYGGNALSTFWIDDVSYQHTPYTLPTVNGAVLGAGFDGPAFTGTMKSPVVEIRNLGAQAITSFDVEVDYNGNKVTESVSGVNIPSLGTYEVTFSQGLNIVQSSTSMVATISNVNGAGADLDPSDDSKTVNFSPITPATGKMVIVEEATGTWCGWCPRGTVAMDYLARDYKGFAQGIAVHNGDPMVNSVYDAGIGGRIGGYPSALVNRGQDIDPSAIFGPVLTDLMVAPKATLTNGARYDATTRVLEVSVTADFLASVSGNWKLACVLTEDSVTGTASGYAQANFYSNSQSLIGVDGVDWMNLPARVPASQMVYDHVARAISPGFNGQPNSFPSTVNANDQHTLNFWFTLDGEWDVDKMHIVAMLISPTGAIDNGGAATVAEAITNGFVAGPNVSTTEYLNGPDDMLKLYPNPAGKGYTDLFVEASNNSVQIAIVDINGRTVYSTEYPALQSDQPVRINTADFAKGIYLVKVTAGQKTETRKLVVE